MNSSVFPPAPHFYKHFTKDNLDKLEELRSKEGFKEEDLSQPLSYLVPPKPPTDKSYRSFGNVWQPDDKLQTLEEVGIEQLYPAISNPGDRIAELKRLLRSLLANYLELTGIMSIHPEKFPAKVEAIRVILINMHHLLNEYRPHQSRENLILLMEQQIKQKRDEIAMIKEKNEKITARIEGMAKEFDLRSHTTPMKLTVPHRRGHGGDAAEHRESDLELWKVLDEHP